jgi:putative aldouronate transport system substrate-binding protein
MVMLVAACGNSDSNNTSNSGSSNSSTNNNSGGQGSNSGGASGDSNESGLEPYELTVALPLFGPVPADFDEVMAEVNEITKEKINATVNFLPISIGSYVQQMNLMNSSGEKLDLSYTFATGGLYSSAIASGSLLPLDDLLEQYGQGIIEAVGRDYVYVPRVDGKLYGIVTVDVFAKGTAYVMRQDLVDKYNIDVASIKNLDDVEKVLQTIKDNEPNIIPLAASKGQGPVTSYYGYDPLGDRLGVLPNYDNNLQVVNLFETEEYAAQLEQVHRWFRAGYINKDASTTTQQPQDLVGAGAAFSYFIPYNHTSEANMENVTGMDLVIAEIVPPKSTTSDVLAGLWTIAQQSGNPERAMMLLNLMYTDAELVNLLVWGIEGKHYVKASENQATFPDGLDAQTVGYNLKVIDWIMGNSTLSYLTTSSDPNQHKNGDAFKARASRSKALGFLFNEDPVKNEGVALRNVIEQYQPALETGSVSPSEKLKEFNDKLKAAGLEKYIAEKQSQLDAWAAANQ